ncbi:LysR family transcriptional regulator [Halorhabdus sp. CBA1104]|uniref:TOBE domain-containing protein n=1 Tax=unclassified Halorhabdus TaxID=2621901 RepID=UPI0012B1B3ED|nr:MULTISPECIES: TOBE domain-containing protein [unclassified Halorhabdus]QGN07746.1 LysR family transcriptional regulator [Halorhabdus sp. CBA1104]
MNAGFSAHLVIDGCTFDAADAALLRAIDAHRSLSAAADALGRSYSRAHDRVTELEAAVGPLVERRRGGADGGGSELTDNAEELLARFARLQATLEGTARTEEVVLEGTVRDREGELATIETKAGTIRALLFEAATDVEVLFRADAITLHHPETAPPAADTSARNRFRGTVTDIERGAAIAHVTVAVADDRLVDVLVTLASVETLDLTVGSSVVATFKATATRALAR